MFKNYKKQPREENWQNIENKLQKDRVHENIKSKFDGFAPTPSSKNWNAIQQGINTPQPRYYALRIAAAAASIALLFFLFVNRTQTNQYNFADFSQNIDFSEELAFHICEDPPIVVLDIVKPVVKTEKKKTRKKRKKKEAKQKRLLDIILADDDNITSKVDSMRIAELLRPANMLPEESMFASTGGSYYYRQGNQFKKMYSLPEVDYHLEMPIDTQGPFLYELLIEGEGKKF